MHPVMIAAIFALSAPFLAQGAEVRYANVTYRLPAGWKFDAGRAYEPCMMKGTSKAAAMTISRPQPSSSFLQDASGLFVDMLRTPLTIEIDGPRTFVLDKGRTCMFLAAKQSTAMDQFAPSGSIAALIDLGDKCQEVKVDVYDPRVFDTVRAGAEQILRSMTFDTNAPPRTPYGWQRATSPSTITASLEIEVAGGGPYVTEITNSNALYKVKRTLSARGIRLVAGTAPLFERSVLNALTDRGEGLASYAQDGPHPATVTIADEDYHDGDIRVAVGVKVHPRFKDTYRWTAPPKKSQRNPPAMVDGLRVAIDRKSGQYVISLPGLAGGVAMSIVDYQRTDYNLSLLSQQTISPLMPIPLSVFAHLQPNLKFTGGALGGSLVRRLPESGKLSGVEDQITVQAFFPVKAYARNKPAGPVTITYKWRLDEE